MTQLHHALERLSNDCRPIKVTPTNHSRSKMHDQPIRIPQNYLSLAQGAGKTTRTQLLDFSKVLTPWYTRYKSYALSLRSLEFGRQY